MKFSVEFLEECPSTNAWLYGLAHAPEGQVIVARNQTSGRGQRGNSWESEPGQNLTFSLLLRPENLIASRQFELSMVVSIAIAEAIGHFLPRENRPEIKWPNDIYVGNKKICGILIQHSLKGPGIDRSVVGVGINVNQEVFLSDAPNPASIVHFNGMRHLDVNAVLDDVLSQISTYYDEYCKCPDRDMLYESYHSMLWRRNGCWPFQSSDGAIFEASIESVTPSGMLELSNGCSYAFKEVSFVL